MSEYVTNLRPSHFKLLKHAASQLAGRKPGRTAPKYHIRPELIDRSHESPYKDIAQATRGELVNWLEEDGHHFHEGGGLHSALVDSFDTMHRYYKDQKDKSVAHVQKIHGALKNVAETARVNIDVTADDFMHRVGLRHHKKYKTGELNQNMKDHIDLHRDVYLSDSKRQGTKRFKICQ